MCMYGITEMEDNDPDGEDDVDEFEEDLEALTAEIKAGAKAKTAATVAAAVPAPTVAVEGEPDKGGKKGEEEDLEGLITSLQKTTLEEKGGK